jgi:hypothetical protein
MWMVRVTCSHPPWPDDATAPNRVTGSLVDHSSRYGVGSPVWAGDRSAAGPVKSSSAESEPLEVEAAISRYLS